MILRLRPLTILAALFGLFWAGGVASYLFLGEPPAGSEWAAPAFLWIGAALVLYASRTRGRLFLLAAGAIGWGSEWLGVRTGYPFGAYRYTEALGPAFGGVPLAMAAAWILLTAYAAQTPSGRLAGRWAGMAAAAAWMTGIDLALDPVAAGPLAFWTWKEGGPYFGIPLLNFAGWFAVSAVIFALRPGNPPPSPAIRRTGAAVVLFFTVIAFAKDLPVPGAAGAALLALHALRFGRTAHPAQKKDAP